MRDFRLFRWSVVLSLFIAGFALAADFAGSYRAPKLALELSASGDGYTGTLTVDQAKFPVTAKEAAGSLEGSFTSQGAKFDFSAQLSGDTLTLKSSGKSYELKREPKPNTPPVTQPANPFENVPAPQQQPQPQGDSPDDKAIAALQDLGPVQSDPKRDWLMLVYLDGDNNLENQGAFNIKQMENGFPDSGVDVLVLYARPALKRKDGSITHPTLFRVRKSEHPDKLDSQPIKDLGPIDMSNPKVLAAFIAGAIKAYPASQHALFTWDHGGGWAGMTEDDYVPGHPHKLMDLPGFRGGVVAGMKEAGLKKWDIIAFDMCLMAQLEVAAEIHDLTDVMIASEANEPGKGMPYSRVMEAFGKGTLGGRKIGANIVKDYDAFHKEDRQRSTTLSAMDMAFFDEVNNKLNALADKLIPAMPANWSSLCRSYFYAEQYCPSREDFRDGKYAVQSIDLMDCLKKCRSAMPDFPANKEYNDLRQAMDQFVIASANSERRTMSNGVAIYAPVIKSAYNPAYEKIIFSKISHWPMLFQSLYPEQARNNNLPKFGKVELVTYDDKPAAAVRPLSGIVTKFEVEGTNLVWVRHEAGIRDPGLNGVRILGQSFVVDDKFLEKLSKGVNKFAQDIDIIMPQLADGKNILRQHQLGLHVLISNGGDFRQVMINNSDLSNPSVFYVLADVEDPTLGDKPIRAHLISSVQTLVVLGVDLMKRLADGRIQEQAFEPTANTKITPLFWVYKDDGKKELSAGDVMTWNKGLYFTMEPMASGEYEDVLTAETMTGASTTYRFRYKGEEDPDLAKANQTWKAFKPEMMLGTWQWAFPGDPPKEIPTLMTIEATKVSFIYAATIESQDKDGNKKVTKGRLIFDLDRQPFYRLITPSPDPGSPDEVMFGTMWWAPMPTQGRVMTRALAFDSNLWWIQKGGRKPPVVKDDLPEGWRRFVVNDRLVSVAIPPAFVPNDELFQMFRQIYRGYDFIAMERNSGAGVEMIRFDGVHDFTQAIRLIIAGRNRRGVVMRLGQAVQTKAGGANSMFVGGNAMGPNGIIYNVGINLIPTANGIVAVDFSCPVTTYQGVAPLIQQIANSIKSAK